MQYAVYNVMIKPCDSFILAKAYLFQQNSAEPSGIILHK
jgi:hypothetical protein